jgi:hypothetical protein
LDCCESANWKRAKIKIVCKIEKMAKWWFNFGPRA